jgi:hypothetical protein
METWATFSIIDHRTPTYRQALALFDKIVVPIPPEPIGDQTREELDQLEVELDYLAKHNAAVRHEWASDVFHAWRAPLLAEATAANMNRNIFLDSRLMLADNFASDDVQAVPVYGAAEPYRDARRSLLDFALASREVEDAITLEIRQRLPIPHYDTPLEHLIGLRENPAFRAALDDLLEWRRHRVLDIVSQPNRLKAIATAMRDFDKLTRTYAEAMESAGHTKLGHVASFFFSVVTGQALGEILKEGLVSAMEVREPCWKRVSQMKCAPGGVVYHFEKTLR